MKKLLFFLGMFIFASGLSVSYAQSIIDDEGDHNYNDFYKKDQVQGREAIPYAYLRESDVVWEHLVWRTIDFREKFNQFFYFPTDPSKDTQGRVNLVNVIMKALEKEQITAYETDDMVKVKTYQELMASLLRVDSVYVPEYDEYDDEIGGHYVLTTEEFEPENVYSVYLKEAWYIDKQDTRQKVRILSLCVVYNRCKTRDDNERTCDPTPLFWIPMNDMRVRNVLVKNLVYDERNSHAERSYDDIFIDRYFDSFCYRESNVMNRPISAYLTGTDAILESQAIEDEIWNIESDMWEY
ncbi:MAG: gliding motility protein GldN [Bacteroidales bacterium]|nr:gliding motility protein GldN [Bacteroidales bacterium]